MIGHYNIGLVALSFLLAISASYAGLSIASRIPQVERNVVWFWIPGGATSLGFAIWSMHFVGMFASPINIPLAYDIPLTGVSILYAVIATTAGLLVVRSGCRNLFAQLLTTFFIGSGIAAMHYTGIDALKIMPGIDYDPFLFTLSLAIAYAATFVSLRLFFAQTDQIQSFRLYNTKRLYASILMGFAIAGVYYTAMEATIFAPNAICTAIGKGIDPGLMSILVVIGVINVILTTLVVLLLDTKDSHNRKVLQSEKRFRQVLNNAPQGMLLVDKSGRINQINRSMLKLSGYHYSELLGKPIENLIPHPLDRQHIKLREDFFTQENPPSKMGNRNVYSLRKDGTQFPVEVTLTPMSVNDEDYVLATVNDITKRLSLEQELAKRQNDLIEANQRIMIATDSAEIGIWEYNLTDQKLIWDDWMYRIHGISSDHRAATYRDWENTLHPDDLEFIQKEIELATRGEKVFDTQYRIIKSKGEVAWIKVNGSLLTNDSGQPVRIIGTTYDITNKVLNEELIWRQANFDSLTSLPNRKLFHELLDQEIKEAHRDCDNLWVLFLDLDGFKEVNDTLGHHAGDELLIKVAKRISSNLREADVVARLGGDEFVVIITKCEALNTVENIAQKLIDSIAESYTLEQDEIHISASIGIANYPNDASNADDLLKFADQSMYVSKQGGKNRISYFTPEYQKSALKRVQITASLRQAIVHSHFELYYQPIIDLKTDNLHKAEALIRWNDPEKGMIDPDGFIPIAEETGIILEIGSWVFDAAFKQLQSWLPRLDDDFQLSINMSPNQLKIIPAKYKDWTEKLKEFSVAGEHVVIEITEGLLLKSDKIVTDRLSQYHKVGVQIAIDDFGTGYSSLAYLKDFNINYLKIDKSFTCNLKPGSKEHALSETIVVMAHKLGLKVIAEGIETSEQLAMLQAMNCDYGQGYLFSRPLPAEEFEKVYIDAPHKLKARR